MDGKTLLPSGNYFYPLQPELWVPCPEDLAHKLAQTNRYGGSCKFPFSVCQHSVLLAKKLLENGYHPMYGFVALFHDSSEPLGFSDLIAPVKYVKFSWRYPWSWLKNKIFVYLHRKAEDKILLAICKEYNVSLDKKIWQIVKDYDKRIVADEKYWCFNTRMIDSYAHPLGIEIKEQDWKETMQEWLDLFYDLRKQIND